MVKIYTKGNYVDFEAPIYMDEEIQKEFIDGMKEIFGDRIKIERIIENKKTMNRKSIKSKKFDINSLLILTNPELDNQEAGIKLGKTEFAIQMKRGPFLKEFLEWARQKEKTQISEIEVEEFLNKDGN
jgi:hypothetical protein